MDRLTDTSGVVRFEGTLTAVGFPVVRGPFAFTFDTPGLTNGVPLWTPAAGDILLDAWFEIETAWDGTTPQADIGAFQGIAYGVFANATPVDLTVLDEVPAAGSISQSASSGSPPSLAGNAHTAGAVVQRRFAPASIFTAAPFLLVVSQDGMKGGADPGAAQGAARLYVITATPVPFG